MASLKFSIETYERLSKETKWKLSRTVIDLFHVINEFAKVYNIKKEVTLYLVDDQLQEWESNTCGFFQLYFYTNLFNPLQDSQILNDNN